MNYSDQNKNQNGQALIELVVIIPLLLVITCLLTGLIAYSQLPSWMDELLAFTLVSQQSINHFEILEKQRKSSMFPRYFNHEEIKLHRVPSKNNSFLLPFHRIFQNNRFEVTGSTNWQKVMSRTSLPLIQTLKGTENHTSKMSFVASMKLDETQSKKLIKSVFLSGLSGNQLMRLLGKLGFNIFHLNFNTLPITTSGKGSSNHD